MKDKELSSWFNEYSIQEVEVIVPDMAGIARGKMLPAEIYKTLIWQELLEAKCCLLKIYKTI